MASIKRLNRYRSTEERVPQLFAKIGPYDVSSLVSMWLFCYNVCMWNKTEHQFLV